MPKKKIKLVDLLPATVRILHSNYDINIHPQQVLKDRGHLGDIEYESRSINIVEQPATEIADTFIHELLHGLFHAFDLSHGDEDKDNEEHIVTVLATGLTTVMKDNPQLFGILQELANG